MADVQNWLTSRLTPANAQSERWTDLAKAVEAFWDHNFEPSMDAFERSRSVFTADDADITLKLAERGKKFEVALPITPSSMAMAYAMRSYEIHQKDHQDALEIVLQRDFGNVRDTHVDDQRGLFAGQRGRFLRRGKLLLRAGRNRRLAGRDQPIAAHPGSGGG